jgi:hypothetical protein
MPAVDDFVFKTTFEGHRDYVAGSGRIFNGMEHTSRAKIKNFFCTQVDGPMWNPKLLETIKAIIHTETITAQGDGSKAQSALLFLKGLYAIQDGSFKGYLYVVNKISRGHRVAYGGEEKHQSYRHRTLANSYANALDALTEVVKELEPANCAKYSGLFDRWFGDAPGGKADGRIKRPPAYSISAIAVKYGKILEGLKKTQQIFSDASDLHGSGSTYGATYRHSSKKDAGWNVVYFGRNFWHIDRYDQMLTLIHEWSHKFCDTEDPSPPNCYGAANCLGLARNEPNTAWINADSVAYFAMDVWLNKKLWIAYGDDGYYKMSDAAKGAKCNPAAVAAAQANAERKFLEKHRNVRSPDLVLPPAAGIK